MTIHNKPYLIILLILVLSCCGRKKSNNFISVSCDTTLNLDTPSFKRHNIINRYGELNPDVEFIQNDIKRAGLKNYVNGYDSIAIRFWYQYAGPETEIVEIRKHCDGWTADFYTIKRHISQGDTIVDIVSRKIGKQPKSGWTDFTTKLFNLHITTLPDFSEIPGYNPANDGHSVHVEISTINQYRIYGYLGPKTKPEIEEAKNLEETMELIEKEFGIKRKIEV